jgi:hypothetical protein
VSLRFVSYSLSFEMVKFMEAVPTFKEDQGLRFRV